MSRNNVIVVAASKNNKKQELRYYVFFNLCMDTQFTEEYVRQLVTVSNKSTRYRGRALIIAHDAQKKIDTEYGVIEMSV
tara:strand:+ start:6383 stop:6619 length:237 start_codon:yes stop_codon:yes gene_type:complete